MLITNPGVRATLAEVLSHPWMILGFNGPPDLHMLHREPLHADQLDHQVIRGMTGFEFGSEQDIEKALVTILESEEYIGAVQHWERKRNIGGHGKDGSRWGDHSNSSLSLSFDSNASSRGDPLTPSEEAKRYAVSASMSTRRVSPMAHSPFNSENHLSHPSLNEPNCEPLDPTSGYHPLLSMYYLAREKLERERVSGPSQYASSQLSIQHSSGAATPASSSEGPGDGCSSSTSGVNIHLNRSSVKREPESPAAAAGSKADYSRELPRLPAPETLLHSGKSYGKANANSRGSDLGLQERGQAEAKEEDARGKEELRRNEKEARRKEQEAKEKEQEVRRKEEAAKEEELKKAGEAVRRREEEVTRREEEVRKREEGSTKCEEEVTKREEEVTKHEEEVRKCEEEVRKCEEDVKMRVEEAQQKELEASQKTEALDICARLFIILQLPESFRKLVCLQEHRAQEMMDLLQKVRLAFWTHIMFIWHAYISLIYASC